MCYRNVRLKQAMFCQLEMTLGWQPASKFTFPIKSPCSYIHLSKFPIILLAAMEVFQTQITATYCRILPTLALHLGAMYQIL